MAHKNKAHSNSNALICQAGSPLDGSSHPDNSMHAIPHLPSAELAKDFHPSMDFVIPLLNALDEGILFIELSGKINLCNRAARNLLALGEKQIIAQLFWEALPDNLLGFSMQQALTSRQVPLTKDIFITLKSHQERCLKVTPLLFLDEKNPQTTSPYASMILANPQGLLISLKDMTDINHLQKAAQRNGRMQELGETASLLAHEIRNPLGGIKGFAALLQRDLSEHPAWQKMATSILTGADNLNKLVTNVLNFARPFHPHIQPTDLMQLLKEIKLSVESDSHLSGHIALVLEPFQSSPSPAPKVPVDQKLLSSALLNLIINAIEASPHGGTIRLSIKYTHSEAQISVADTGEGIPPDNIKKLFKPFFTTKPNGNGFGLVEVKKVAQAHGGSVEVLSEMDQGSTFSIKIPLEKS